jgi:hypothetical protein
VLDIVIFAVFGNSDKVVVDQVLSSCTCLLPWRLIVNLWVSTSNPVDVVVKSLEDLLT